MIHISVCMWSAKFGGISPPPAPLVYTLGTVHAHMQDAECMFKQAYMNNYKWLCMCVIGMYTINAFPVSVTGKSILFTSQIASLTLNFSTVWLVGRWLMLATLRWNRNQSIPVSPWCSWHYTGTSIILWTRPKISNLRLGFIVMVIYAHHNTRWPTCLHQISIIFNLVSIKQLQLTCNSYSRTTQ